MFKISIFSKLYIFEIYFHAIISNIFHRDGFLHQIHSEQLVCLFFANKCFFAWIFKQIFSKFASFGSFWKYPNLETIQNFLFIWEIKKKNKMISYEKFFGMRICWRIKRLYFDFYNWNSPTNGHSKVEFLYDHIFRI